MKVRIGLWLLLTLAIPAWAAEEKPAPIIAVTHQPAQPHSGEAVEINAQLPGVTAARLLYQPVDPGRYIEFKDAAYQTNWTTVPMMRQPGDGVFTATLPGALQTHRRLVRYRVVTVDSQSHTNVLPGPEDSTPNFGYFVYDGVPPWRGAIEPKSKDAQRSAPVEFGTNIMRRVQAYHLLGKRESVENVTWREQAGGKEYKYTGTLVIDGRVYDHIRYRARGGVWRFAMGKNMWKFDSNKGHSFEVRDDFGRPYPVKWGKLNLRACIDQGDYGMRGNQGMFEAVGFRLFNLAGVESPATHWMQLRIIDEPEENPASQYRGDFWGLYLAIENEDGRFLESHGLPDGNVYKMEGGDGTISHQGLTSVTNHSDLDKFLTTYNSNIPTDDWWRTNLDLPCYYSYRSILECIHHYDISDGKNYDYYRNPETGRWQVVPWDIDLTWADHMYGGGNEPFRSRVLRRPTFLREYRNRLREIRDLLFNPEQTGQLIDECAAVIADPAGKPSFVDADRAKWDYHPVMAMGGKAGQGLFYEAAPAKNFAGMTQLMKDWVKRRGAWIDGQLLGDQLVPATPAITYAGPPGFPSGQLKFRASEYKGTNAFAALKWRVAEISPPNAPVFALGAPRKYEITPVWESAELTNFNAEITLPANAVKSSLTYRTRVRMKDDAGRWSHWSSPVEFVAGK